MLIIFILVMLLTFRSYRDKTGKMRSFMEAIRPLIPLTVFFLISCLWAIFSPNNIIDKDPRMFYILAGTIFSNISVINKI